MSLKLPSKQSLIKSLHLGRVAIAVATRFFLGEKLISHGSEINSHCIYRRHWRLQSSISEKAHGPF